MVTIILPVYNGANYLRESIDSVLRQTYTDFELHILDDGSTDESPAIAKSYSDPRVRYSKNDGRFGLFKTLNRGCREATTPWVRLWAHDDRMTPDSLAAFMAFATKHPECGMIYCDFLDMDAAGVLTGTEVDHQPQRDRTPDIADADTSALLFLCFGCLPGNISTVMLKRETWEAIGGFVEGIQQAPDYDMWVRISELDPVGFIRQRVVELRGHELQLGRQGQKLVTLIAEEKMVFDRLKCRLVPTMMTEREFVRFWRSYKGRGHFHMSVRVMMKGQFELAKKGFAAVRGYGPLLPQAWVWLSTLNGRIGNMDKARFFDTIEGRIGRKS